MPYPFKSTGTFTGSINPISYFSDSDNKLFYKDAIRDFWFGFSPFDVTEFSVFDYDNNQIYWGVTDNQPEYEKLTFSYENEKNQIVEYSYNQFVIDNILYKNDKILNSISDQVSNIGLKSGDYKIVYNYVRNVAGDYVNLLSIKDISPSRKEIKIIPTTNDVVRFQSFCQKKFQIKDVSSLLIQYTNNCTYDELYRKVKDKYSKEIEFLQFIFSLYTEGDVLRFLKNLYEDYVQYVSMSSSDIASGESPDRIQRIQGIRTYFHNWIRQNNDSISDFTEVENKFIEFVWYRINKVFLPYKNQTSQEYVGSKQFIYDFFVEYFYKETIDHLEESYIDKYTSYFKNVLNFGNNDFVLILNHDFLQENGEMVLLIKLSEELPSDKKIKDRCWISNVGMIPYIFQASVREKVSSNTVKISPPNFSITYGDFNTKNINKLYNENDLLQETSLKDDDILIQKKITELNVDYTSFNNFIVFSSAVDRLGVFKNKIIDWYTLSSSLSSLQTYSSSTYPYYSEEVDDIEEQMTDIVESFDGYEAYLFNTKNYTYNVTSSTWNSSSYVTAMDDDASEYDRNNSDSLITNTPDYIKLDDDNEEYLQFLSMIGHYFDNLYLFIKSMPTERYAQNKISGSMSTNMIKNMLSSFGWDVDDIFGDGSIDNVYLNSSTGGSNSMSDLERMQNIWNRILVTLPQLYKTKGTEECVRLILACHGIPNNLISVKEYGGIDYSANVQISCIQNEKTYMMKMTPSYARWDIPFPHKAKTLEFKFAFDNYENYKYGDDIPMVCYLPSPFVGGLGQWRVGVRKEMGKFEGKVYFRLHKTGSYDNLSGSVMPYTEISSSVLPLFNGNVFSVMLRRNYPSTAFATSSLTASSYFENLIPTKYDLYVQKNESGRVVFKSTSSAILTKEYNQAFSDTTKLQGNRILVGNWYSSYDNLGNSFIGLLDKIRLWAVPIDDIDFEDHVNDFNSYSWYSSSADNLLQKNLYFLSDVYYPIDVSNIMYVTGSLSGSCGAVYFPHVNDYYTTTASWIASGSMYTGSIASSSCKCFSWIPYNDNNFRSGSYVLFVNGIWQNISHSLSADGCIYTTHSIYPYQYYPLSVNQAYSVGKYGPNKFKNDKIKKSSLSLDVRLDDLYRSTYPNETLVSPDSNIFGFFSDPQESRNKDIVNYLGNSGILDEISDPLSLYSSSYSGLASVRDQYSKNVNKRTLFTELISLNKLYFDKSIFSTVKKVAPARANTLTGILVEPSVIERPKYQHKYISSSLSPGDLGLIDNILGISNELLWTDFSTDISTSSIPRYYDAEMYDYIQQINDGMSADSDPVKYFQYLDLVQRGEIVLYKGFQYLIDDYKKILWKDSMPPNYSDVIDIRSINNPNICYDVNYGGMYIRDLMDDYQMGWFADKEYTYRNDSVVSNGFNPSGAVSYATNNGHSSGSATYYLMKRWKKYSIYAKTGEYVHDDSPHNDLYNTSSVYLYDIIHVNEDFYKSLVYMNNNDINGIYDPCYTYESGFGYKHRAGTFISSSNEIVNNIKVKSTGPGKTDLESYIDFSGLEYLEVFGGYPRNHYTHKMQLFSTERFLTYYNNISGSSFTKGKQTIETTIGLDGLGDDSLPVTSIEVSNVNVVSGDNVLD